MPRGSRCETVLSICSGSKVCPTTRSTDRLLWLTSGPSIGPWGRWKSESFPACHFPHHSVREVRLPRLSGQFVWSKQESHTGGKTTITRLVLHTDPQLDPLSNSPPRPVLMLPFGWFWLIGFVFVLAFRGTSRPAGFISHIVSQRLLIVIPTLSEGKNTVSWQKTKHHPPTGSQVTNSPGQNLSFYL